MAQDLTEEVRNASEEQIADLRGQLASITRSMREHGFDLGHLRDEAHELVDGAAKNARRAAGYAQSEAKAIARVARKNPAGATTVITLAAALGFVAGFVACQIQHENDHRHWW